MEPLPEYDGGYGKLVRESAHWSASTVPLKLRPTTGASTADGGSAARSQAQAWASVNGCILLLRQTPTGQRGRASHNLNRTAERGAGGSHAAVIEA